MIKKLTTALLAATSLLAGVQQESPSSEYVHIVVGCTVTRTYGWNQAQAYRDFKWSNPRAYSTGTSFVGNFQLPCPYRQNSLYRVNPIYGWVLKSKIQNTEHK
jgi:hypothetical protein